VGGRAELEYLRRALARQGIEIPPARLQCLAGYAGKLLEANRRVNLTGAANWEELVDRQLVDCVVGLGLISWDGVELAVDVGSGGGLPGLVLAVLHPAVRVRLVESRVRRARFLQRCAAELGLANVEVAVGRAEELAHRGEWREAADRVTARGLAPLAVLLELSLPFLAPGGRLLAWKGPAVVRELEEAAVALRVLGGRVAGRYGYRLADGRERWLLVVEKNSATPPRYPRRPGVPEKKPLGWSRRLEEVDGAC
jgi:16S rRNA (guanine527-N7)-methyltransferase